MIAVKGKLQGISAYSRKSNSLCPLQTQGFLMVRQFYPKTNVAVFYSRLVIIVSLATRASMMKGEKEGNIHPTDLLRCRIKNACLSYGSWYTEIIWQNATTTWLNSDIGPAKQRQQTGQSAI